MNIKNYSNRELADLIYGLFDGEGIKDIRGCLRHDMIAICDKQENDLWIIIEYECDYSSYYSKYTSDEIKILLNKTIMEYKDEWIVELIQENAILTSELQEARSTLEKERK